MERMKIGEQRIFSLEKEGVGGYTWQLSSGGTVKGLRVEQLDTAAPDKNAPGAPATARFKITGLEPGHYNIRFVLKRIWESAHLPSITAAERAFSISIE